MCCFFPLGGSQCLGAHVSPNPPRVKCFSGFYIDIFFWKLSVKKVERAHIKSWLHTSRLCPDFGTQFLEPKMSGFRPQTGSERIFPHFHNFFLPIPIIFGHRINPPPPPPPAPLPYGRATPPTSEQDRWQRDRSRGRPTATQRPTGGLWELGGGVGAVCRKWARREEGKRLGVQRRSSCDIR